MSIPILLFVLLGNLWIWQIFSFNVILGFIIIAASIFLFLAMAKNKKFSVMFFALFILILIFQWKTTERMSLTTLSNDEQRLQKMRLKQYPPEQLRFGYWFEGRPESIAFFRILRNFSEVIDPNLYFFANHPRERVGTRELEKFPYVFLPFFFLGLVLFISKLKSQLILAAVLPALLISLIGHKNPLGPFALFPVMVVTILMGTGSLYGKLRKLSEPVRMFVLAGGLGVFILVLLQALAYAKY